MSDVTTSISYDEVLYDGGLIEGTHPEHLATLAMLFNMRPEALEHCRVLEIGCATGGNLIPMAYSLPNASFVGLDPASAQLDSARAYADSLGVSNITFSTGDIRDFKDSGQQFDYIICHGVFSWVPSDVRDAILTACKNLLSPNGLAYVSYNTLPGFYFRAPVRDVMRFHSRYFPETQERLEQAIAILGFLHEATGKFQEPGMLSTYREVVAAEAEVLQGRAHSYIAHEHLADENQPFYFHEFADMLTLHGLQYVADSAFESMLVQNLPEGLGDSINAIANSQIALEQYRDFVVNRMFRKSVFCRDDVELKRDISVDAIAALRFRGVASRGNEEPWRIPRVGGSRVEVRDPGLIALLDLLGESAPASVSFDDLLARMPAQQNITREHLSAMLLSLFAHAALEFRHWAPDVCATISERPALFPPARSGERRSSWTPTPFHTSVLLDRFIRHLLPSLDGSKTVAQLAQTMGQKLDDGEQLFAEMPEGVPTADDLERLVNEALEQLRFRGLLES